MFFNKYKKNLRLAFTAFAFFGLAVAALWFNANLSTTNAQSAPDAARTNAPTATASFSEGFEDITTLPSKGWFIQNNSVPVGSLSWFQGNVTNFSAQSGPPDSYISVNFNSTTGTNTISNWLLTPTIMFNNGDVITFWTKTPNNNFPDRLQVRLSTNGASTNVGTGPTAVGDFTTLLLDIDPTYAGTYPTEWTKYRIKITGLTGETSGRIAFRYFVEDGGPSGNNSNLIGIDTFSYQAVKGALYDFTGNGRTDWTFFDPFGPTGSPLRWNVLGNPAPAGPNQAFIRIFDYGIRGDSIVPADYRGDKKTDVTVWRPSTAIFYTAEFPIGPEGITVTDYVRFGATGDVAGGEGDYDGDGKIDYTLVRVSNNLLTYYILLSSTGAFRGVQFGQLAAGVNTSLIKGADFNGDGTDELVLLNRDASGVYTYSIGNAVTGVDIATIPWGNFNTDYGVTPADYTGDGIADLVAVRETTNPATWLIRNTATGTFTGIRFGIGDASFAANDLPIRGDYDGDGVMDVAVYRPSLQNFYVRKSSDGGVIGQNWGKTTSDVPLAFFGVY